ncbi:hypothetical protein DPMN_148149 [Dreissena polymorpha]|uniref:Uncharacterized protein n=1 Tax=Dreissena polymorpha TaxID=45954 RepID=A0A9D4FF03_DREPO|nr:hypothetical protein DPMN_148149 [Dreissena polymorpha]
MRHYAPQIQAIIGYEKGSLSFGIVRRSSLAAVPQVGIRKGVLEGTEYVHGTKEQ